VAGRDDGVDLCDVERREIVIRKSIRGMAQLKCKDSPDVAQLFV